jgi:hypothetical protein
MTVIPATQEAETEGSQSAWTKVKEALYEK